MVRVGQPAYQMMAPFFYLLNSIPGNEFCQLDSVGIEQLLHTRLTDGSNDDLTNLSLNFIINAQGFHAFALFLIVIGGANIMH